jgi:predicted RNA binding protein YcfA (HicA-like mRNA interferase family)
MAQLPVLKPNQVVAALEKMGYRKYRQKGSHLIMIRDDDKIHQPVIPMHRKDLAKGTLRAIIRQLDLTVDEFIKYL